MRTTESAVAEVGMQLVRYNCRQPKQSLITYHFKRSFGASPFIVKKVWNLLLKQNLVPEKGKIVHLLWSLAFLKSYSHESVYENWFKKHRHTLRKWIWKFIAALSRLKVVSTTIFIVLHVPRCSMNFSNDLLIVECKIKLENRFIADNGSRCLMTVDGTDFRILEPQPFHKKWYSHKYHGPGLRYEVGLGIQTGWMVWAYGPFRCGEMSDLKIARKKILNLLQHGEQILTDRGYRGARERADTPSGMNTREQRMKSIARSRHETCNKRLKQWSVLSSIYRHKCIKKHGQCFFAVANITQMIIMFEEPLFEVRYDDIRRVRP